VVGFVFEELYLLLYGNRPPAKAENPKENKAKHIYGLILFDGSRYCVHRYNYTQDLM
jgi:hypothetical protein